MWGYLALHANAKISLKNTKKKMYLANVLIGSFGKTVAVLKKKKRKRKEKKLLKKREGPRIGACTIHSKREEECLFLLQGICIVVFIHRVCDAPVCRMCIMSAFTRVCVWRPEEGVGSPTLSL